MNPICNTVLTYYTPVPGLWSPDSQWALIDVWRRSWQKAGWTPVVMTPADVVSHPRYEFFREHFEAKPTEYGVTYTAACFMRWLAAHHYGALRGIPIFLSDYDCINYSFPPQELRPNEMTLFCEEPPAPIFMGSVLGTPQHYLDIAELFAAAKPDKHDWHARLAIYHQDDLSLLRRMFMDGTLKKPDWFVRRPGCRIWGRANWETAPIVHYAYAMKEAGYWPKHAYIEKLRPF